MLIQRRRSRARIDALAFSLREMSDGVGVRPRSDPTAMGLASIDWTLANVRLRVFGSPRRADTDGAMALARNPVRSMLELDDLKGLRGFEPHQCPGGCRRSALALRLL